MVSNKVCHPIRWWLTPKFPEAQIEKSLGYKPKGLYQQLKNAFRTWVIHPIKRRVARYYLLFLKSFFDLSVIAITGSSGKTTTKEIIASILRQKGQTVASFANIDPVYNIPTTILKCRPSTKYLVLEMGVEYPGEMDFYLWLARPDIGLITNISLTHTEFFGDENGVLKEKSKLVKELSKNSYAILNVGDKLSMKIGRKLRARKVWFGDNTEIRAKAIEITKNFQTKYILEISGEETDVLLPVPGEQFVENSLAAAAVGYILGVNLNEIKKGIEKFSLQAHRMQVSSLSNGTLVIDDTYNNNPEAAKKALDSFNDLAGNRKKIIIFGDMLELGAWSTKEHREIGLVIGKMKVFFLITVGQFSKLAAKSAEKFMPKKNIVSVESSGEVIRNLPELTNDTALFIKGSRSIELEKVVSRLPRLVR